VSYTSVANEVATFIVKIIKLLKKKRWIPGIHVVGEKPIILTHTGWSSITWKVSKIHITAKTNSFLMQSFETVFSNHSIMILLHRQITLLETMS
jgi:hypothetical protein